MGGLIRNAKKNYYRQKSKFANKKSSSTSCECALRCIIQWTISDMVKYRAVSFKKAQIAALYSTMLIVHFYLVVNYNYCKIHVVPGQKHFRQLHKNIAPLWSWAWTILERHQPCGRIVQIYLLYHKTHRRICPAETSRTQRPSCIALKVQVSEWRKCSIEVEHQSFCVDSMPF